jgi:hypothetical protein
MARLAFIFESYDRGSPEHHPQITATSSLFLFHYAHLNTKTLVAYPTNRQTLKSFGTASLEKIADR